MTYPPIRDHKLQRDIRVKMFSLLYKIIVAYLTRIAERAGVHICSEFTQWEQKKSNVLSRVPVYIGSWKTGEYDEFEETRRWQERRCTICGRLQREELKT